MRTYLECIPCFFKQALEAAKICGAEESVQKKILDNVAKILPEFTLDSSPPEMGRIIHKLVKQYTGQKDPYMAIKEESNRFALGIYDELKKKVKDSDDSLLTAVKFAIAGNIIDYGVKNSLNVEEELKKILEEEQRTIEYEDKKFFSYDKFREKLKKSKNILYLADNAGETVFDRVLIEELKDMGKDIVYAVKEEPIINDALALDAILCGIDNTARITSSGVDSPGTILSLCSRDFIQLYEQADMIISKGQGNFEALSSTTRPVFFLFMAKCPVIAKNVGCKIGDILLCYHEA